MSDISKTKSKTYNSSIEQMIMMKVITKTHNRIEISFTELEFKRIFKLMDYDDISCIARNYLKDGRRFFIFGYKDIEVERNTPEIKKKSDIVTQ